MATAATIQAGCAYFVKLPEFAAEVRVRAICPDIVRPGWWNCENLQTGEPIVLPIAEAIWQREADKAPAD
jgi:hypothetical protein